MALTDRGGQVSLPVVWRCTNIVSIINFIIRSFGSSRFQADTIENILMDDNTQEAAKFCVSLKVL